MRGILAIECRALSVYALILSQLTSPILREVILSEGIEHEPKVIDMALLPGVTAALKGRQFAHVQRVVFPSFSWRPGDQAAREYLKKELSELDRRGILVFDDVRGYYGERAFGDPDSDSEP
jgi:hypothetical protein